MPLFIIDDNSSHFPPVDLAEPDGLLAMGGELSTSRLLEAYRHGIFPWYSGDTPLWWSPDPRFILYPEELRITKKIRPILKKSNLRFTVNQTFGEVIHQCRHTIRPGQDGTWITPEVERSYTLLHDSGYAHSAEVWQDDLLVGGLYGVRIGKVFFGESMFSKISNASRIAFIKYVQLLQSEGVRLIDCQVYTEYLETFGAKMIDRRLFSSLLEQYL